MLSLAAERPSAVNRRPASNDGGSSASRATNHETSARHSEGAVADGVRPGLTEQVHAAREAERARIARDLDEDLGELLAALRMDLAWLDARLSHDQLPALLKVRFMTHLVNRITDTVRRICSELRPAILDDLGLPAAIQWQASTFEHRTGLQCIVSIEGMDRVGEQATGLFRIFQELLTHIARHAHATVVWVTLKEVAGWLTLEVRDNGRGLLDENRERASPTLLALKERTVLLRGELSVNGTPGRGTSVSVKIPAPGHSTSVS